MYIPLLRYRFSYSILFVQRLTAVARLTADARQLGSPARIFWCTPSVIGGSQIAGITTHVIGCAR